MRDVEFDLKKEIKRVFGIQEKDITEFTNLEGSNYVYSFIAKKQKFAIKKLIDSTIMNWKQEKAAYNVLSPFDITDEVVSFDNGIKIARFIDNAPKLSYSESDQIDALDKIRIVHESGVSIKYHYDIVENMDKYINLCHNKNSEELNELEKHRDKIKKIQTKVDKLKIPPVLCHGDACVNGNFLRLSDGSIKIIDWEQAGMADPLLDIAIATLHQGFENVDPVWCLHHYLKRAPSKQEYLRLFSFLALYSFASSAWCIYTDPEDYRYCLNTAIKYSELVLNYY